ncbi:MAG: SBBP repeat-containing protein [Candidatus Thorarchaeota archaeon]
MAVDSSGNAYVTGYTRSPDFPTVNAYNSTYGGGGDCFVLKLIISDYTPDFYYIVASRILQLIQYIYQVVLGLVLFTHQVVLGAINLIALGLVLFTPVYMMRILISRPTTDITGIPPPDHKRLTCQLCSATYLYGPQHLTNPEVLRCQNCDREFQSEAIRSPEETVPMSIVHVSVAYMLLSRLRESRWNIFRRKEESE